MGQHRYHIHVCLVKNEQPEFENAWQIASTNSYFLTWDLMDMSMPYLSYSRQQIEKCDCVLFVLDDSYGQLSPSGISFLHLCYIFAKTKRKPLFALIKNPADFHERRRTDFAELIEKEQAGNVGYYHLIAEAVKVALAGLHQLKPQYANAGWVQNTAKKISKDNDSLFSPKMVTNSTSATLPVDTITADLEPAAIKRPRATRTTTTAKTDPSVNPAVTTVTTANVGSSLSGANPDLHAIHATPIVPILPSETLIITDTIMVSYSAHAYQDGNLSDLMLTHSFSWQEILDALKTLPTVFSNDAILKKFNELLSQTALAEALQVMPNAHAVSRCQINTLDFQWVKKQLVNHHFLLKAADERGTRELWQVNPQVK